MRSEPLSRIKDLADLPLSKLREYAEHAMAEPMGSLRGKSRGELVVLALEYDLLAKDIICEDWEEDED